MSDKPDSLVSRRTLMGTVGVGALAMAAGPDSKPVQAAGSVEKDGFSITRGYAAGPFGQVHYQDVSPSNPQGLPLLLIHQAPMSLRQFDNVYGPLAQRGVRSIEIDRTPRWASGP